MVCKHGALQWHHHELQQRQVVKIRYLKLNSIPFGSHRFDKYFLKTHVKEHAYIWRRGVSEFFSFSYFKILSKYLWAHVVVFFCAHSRCPSLGRRVCKMLNVGIHDSRNVFLTSQCRLRTHFISKARSLPNARYSDVVRSRVPDKRKRNSLNTSFERRIRG